MLQILAFAAIVLCDQAVKYWAVEYLNKMGSMDFIPKIMDLTYVENTGAAFSMLRGNLIFLIIIPIIVCILIACVLLSKKKLHSLLRWSLLLILGGACGNLIDRIFRGYVVDMFEITLFKFAIFNVADIFITIGAVLLMIFILFFMSDTPEDKNE